MLAFFAVLQTGQESRKAAQFLHEQRCLQGRNKTHELRKLQHLQTIVVVVFLVLSSSCPCPWSATSPAKPLFSAASIPSLFTSQHDSASSTPLLKQQEACSRSCSRVLFKEKTIASFSCATLCHAWFSISSFFNRYCNSIVLFAAFVISSSFCPSKTDAFGSIFFTNTATCCFLCSCSNNFNLSFWIKVNKKNQEAN